MRWPTLVTKVRRLQKVHQFKVVISESRREKIDVSKIQEKTDIAITSTKICKV